MITDGMPSLGLKLFFSSNRELELTAFSVPEMGVQPRVVRQTARRLTRFIAIFYKD